MKWRLRTPYKDIETKRRRTREAKAKWVKENPELNRVQKHEWYVKNKDNVHSYLIFRNFGLTKEKYNALLVSQNGVCAICKKPNTKERRLAVDHNHETNVVRGLLCHNCNLAVGNLKDSVYNAEQLLEYLKLHTKDTK